MPGRTTWKTSVYMNCLAGMSDKRSKRKEQYSWRVTHVSQAADNETIHHNALTHHKHTSTSCSNYSSHGAPETTWKNLLRDIQTRETLFATTAAISRRQCATVPGRRTNGQRHSRVSSWHNNCTSQCLCNWWSGGCICWMTDCPSMHCNAGCCRFAQQVKTERHQRQWTVECPTTAVRNASNNNKLSRRAQPVGTPDDRLLETTEKEIKSFLRPLSPISSPVRPPAIISDVNLISKPQLFLRRKIEKPSGNVSAWSTNWSFTAGHGNINSRQWTWDNLWDRADLPGSGGFTGAMVRRGIGQFPWFNPKSCTRCTTLHDTTSSDWSERNCCNPLRHRRTNSTGKTTRHSTRQDWNYTHFLGFVLSTFKVQAELRITFFKTKLNMWPVLLYSLSHYITFCIVMFADKKSQLALQCLIRLLPSPPWKGIKVERLLPDVLMKQFFSNMEVMNRL